MTANDSQMDDYDAYQAASMGEGFVMAFYSFWK